ncbi:MAG: AAA family ATPase [Ignavibacteriae bacterium]|nr:MAG: AAA family ATPase [Ignavibacteriota bacterium]
MKKRIKSISEPTDLTSPYSKSKKTSAVLPQKSEIQPFSTNAIGIPADFQLTREFSETFDRVEQSEHHFYITGNAGTGKSTLLQYFKEKTKKKTVVLAPTGIAAINIGGSTLHSFFRFPFHLITKADIKKIRGKGKLFAALDTLVIDEVSMVRADMMDAVDQSLRVNRNRLSEPFGGVQVVLIGDLFQLPPIVDEDLAEYYSDFYETPFFFSAHVFNEVRLQKIELQNVFRQTDPEFIGLLNKVRNNTMGPSDIDVINQRYHPSVIIGRNDLAITLTSTNALASAINLQRLSALTTREYSYESIIDGEFDEKSFPTDKKLKLKVGAQVMMVKNDPNKRWVNGTLGVVHHLTEETIEVSFGGTVHTIEPSIWEKLDYAYDRELRSIEPVVNGAFRQYPIKLAWAMTIHKSQGKTFDNVIIDLGRGAFAHGQAYVALSRCRSFSGLHLKTPLRYSDIILDPRVRTFHSLDVVDW